MIIPVYVIVVFTACCCPQVAKQICFPVSLLLLILYVNYRHGTHTFIGYNIKTTCLMLGSSISCYQNGSDPLGHWHGASRGVLWCLAPWDPLNPVGLRGGVSMHWMLNEWDPGNLKARSMPWALYVPRAIPEQFLWCGVGALSPGERSFHEGVYSVCSGVPAGGAFQSGVHIKFSQQMLC